MRPIRLTSAQSLIGCFLCMLAAASAEPLLSPKAVAIQGPSLLSVRIVPPEITLWGAAASQQFLMLGKYSDGLERDLTSKSRFSIRRSALAKVDESGRVRAIAEGRTELEAQVAGQVAEAYIQVASVTEETPFSFARDIGAVLTKRGCNSSECHGSVKGKGGFKLSLDALNPRDDHAWIVEGGTYQVLTAEPAEPIKPRINLDEPENSLLLLKPTLSVPHQGGQRFSQDSSDYQTILNWVREGVPFQEEGSQEGERIERVEVFPMRGILDREGRQQLLVSAYLSNGRREDITDEVRFVSSNPEVVKVSPQGVIQAVSRGETAIVVRAVGHVVTARFGVIADLVSHSEKEPSHNFIDDHVFGKLSRHNIVPSGRSSDAGFLRRVCLDLTGTLPPPNRVREFLSSRDPRKREELIEILLNAPEYVDYWTFRFADLFRVAYAENGSPPHSYAYWMWIRDNIAQNKPYDQIALERISAQGFDGPSRHYSREGGNASGLPPQEIMAEQVRVFMGRRLDCAQCHNHPFENWSQDQFWGMAAFFGQLSRTEWIGDGTHGALIFDDPAGPDPDLGEPEDSVKIIHPRTKSEVQPAFLDGTPLSASQMSDPRLELGRWISSHPYFAEASVNRIWGYLFGRGIVDPVDDFRAVNPPTHPELLQALAQDFREHGYDLRHLIGRIVRSRTYQLSSVSNENNKEDKINYSHRLPRVLEAEVLLDAISQVTGIPEVFNNSWKGIAPPGTRAIALRVPDMYPSAFLDMYGRTNRASVAERDGDPNLKQALHTLVGSTYTAKLSQTGSRLDGLLRGGNSDRGIIQELYLAALSRFPTSEEEQGLKRVIAQRSSRREAFEDVLWAIITSEEFVHN